VRAAWGQPASAFLKLIEMIIDLLSVLTIIFTTLSIQPMNCKIFITVLLVSCLVYYTACLPTRSGHSESGPKVGGWQEIDRTVISQYRDVLEYLQKNTALLAQRFRLLKVERQVVAGFKYRMLFMIEKDYREIVVWKKTDGSMQLMD
jgi:hypothetical protein